MTISQKNRTAESESESEVSQQCLTLCDPMGRAEVMVTLLELMISGMEPSKGMKMSKL